MLYVSITGLIITVVGGLVAYLLHTNTRITATETAICKIGEALKTLAKQDERIRGLEQKSAVHTELLNDIRQKLNAGE